MLPFPDEVEYAGRIPAEGAIIGGAGSYAAIGARLVAGDRYAGFVSWIVDAGSDFPRQFRSLIDSWETDCIFREDRARFTTRAWNSYSGGNEHRGRAPCIRQTPRTDQTDAKSQPSST